MVTLLIAYLLVGGAAVYLAVCVAAFIGLLRRRGERADAFPTVSVIIAARNEEHNIGAVLDDLLAQTYPADRFDITVVNDCSEDGTAAVAGEYAARSGRISLRETGNSKSPYSHKKKAVHEGIMESDGEIVMTVDADCRVPRNWIGDMVSHFRPGVDLVAGEILVEGGGLMGWLESLEFTGIQMMSAGLMN
ncbi:MAG: glycosyltransferase, partial [Candidatus Latescibacteria bacterium]|nr:glycosyltransferase [Candidatus Latescibacterota bacterium]